MARWVNHSGTAISVPAVGHDVEDGEEVEVSDDVLLPENYFRRADVKKAAASSKKEGE